MFDSNSSDRQYADDYATLQIDSKSDWKTVRASYRQLVNRWHPDKFPANSREKHHAQQQFIDLTRSYTSLRNYYRKTGQLPLQEPGPGAEFSRSKAQQKRNSATSDAAFPGTNNIRHSRHRNVEPGSNRWWPVCAALLVLATAAILLFHDNRATRATLEQARDAIEQAPESEFTTDNSEIRKVKLREGLLKQPGL
ncbi:MAG: DnaJ domain-containing protein [Granulosicoccus sp.]